MRWKVLVLQNDPGAVCRRDARDGFFWVMAEGRAIGFGFSAWAALRHAWELILREQRKLAGL